MTAEAPASRFIHRIGRLVAPHGLDGHASLRLFRARRDPPVGQVRKARSPQPVELELADETLRAAFITSARFVEGHRVVLRFEGIRDRDAAEALRGAFVDIDPSDAPGLLADDYDRMFGARVVDVESGRALGRVDDVRDTGAHAIIHIGELMIPAIPPFVERAQLQGADRQIDVRLIPGLLDVNA